MKLIGVRVSPINGVALVDFRLIGWVIEADTVVIGVVAIVDDLEVPKENN